MIDAFVVDTVKKTILSRYKQPITHYIIYKRVVYKIISDVMMGAGPGLILVHKKGFSFIH